MSELVDPTHTSTGLDNRKLGMWIFLATEIMLFSALIATFLQMKARSPADANQILNIPLTAINTFILIISSTTVVLGLAAIQDGEKKTAPVSRANTFAGSDLSQHPGLRVHASAQRRVDAHPAACSAARSTH